MSLPLDILESQVLSLPASDRSHLLDRLVASIEADQDIQRAWDLEAVRRDIETQTGQVRSVTGSAVIARLCWNRQSLCTRS